MNWHLLDISEVLTGLRSDIASGLSTADASSRLLQHGPNELLDRGGKSPWRILWEQFTSIMALILTGAALISALVGSLKDCIAIMAIVCLFALLGFFQEYRAERTIRALKRLAIPSVKVRRDGMILEIPSVDLVPGDVVFLEAGNIVPADCRVAESYNLRIQESVLTGEAEAVDKCTTVIGNEAGSLGERRNMAFMGTTVTYGRGLVLVVETGMSTELGKIADMLQGMADESTPLQRRLDRLGKLLAVVAIAVSALYFVFGLLRGEELRLLLMTAVSLAVAAIPEGLPAVVTITLAIGSQRMLKRQALIRKLPAVETLGSVTVICSDKTGTLTENCMTVTELIPVPPYSSDQLLLASALCNDAVASYENGRPLIVGEPTENALLAAAAEAGIFKKELEELFPRSAEIPFDSSTKRMITLHSVTQAGSRHLLASSAGLSEGKRFIVAKGALDALLPFCRGEESLLQQTISDAEKLAAQGRRVLACAGRILGVDESFDLETVPQQMELIGLIAMMDPPRGEARSAVSKCLQAGIRPVMITGDHPLTASSIAQSLGIAGNDSVMTGAELDRIGVDGLAVASGHVLVYARVSPEHKLLIVDALKKSGEVVAMTGDGVNDAPALKKADIGISMGITGTDVAKEAADMVLLDDNFATIVSAVEEGRTIYDNIRKFIEFSVAGNLGKILAVLILPFLGLPSPLTPLQLLWLNLLTDGLLGLGMGVERAEPDVMRRSPVSPSSQIFDRRMLRHTLLTGGVIGLTTIIITLHHRDFHPGTWQTMLFTSLAFAQIGQAMALRSFSYSFFKVGFFSNPLLLGMVCLVLLLQTLVISVPTFQDFFSTTTIGLESLAWVFVPGIAVFIVLEIEKCLVGRKPAVTG
ncbi:MAG: cation-translocating P-type ATPase [Desulfuromonadaceae bacterium]|nr:cation-translocating P-type ATPase [Desulfuromonadaceae bacterium]